MELTSHASFRCSNSTIKIPELSKKYTQKYNRTPFDNAALVYLFLCFNFTHVSCLVLMFLLLPLNM